MWDAKRGRWCGSGWIEIERQPRAATVLELAAGLRRAPLHAAAPVGASQPAALDHHGNLSHAPVGDAPVQTGAPVGPDAPLDEVTNLGVLLHTTNL